MPGSPSSSYTAELLPAGFHPTLHLVLNETADASSDDACALWASLALPSSFIADRYQLHQLQSEHRLGVPGSLRVSGDTDLEAPVSRAGPAEVLLRLRDPKGKSKATEWDIPLHLRYLEPVQTRWVEGRRQDLPEVELTWPALFWACEEGHIPASAATSCPIPTNPHLAAQFPLATKLHFLSPSLSTSASCPPLLPTTSVLIPTGVLDDLPVVELVNFAAIWLGALWIAWKAWGARRNMGRRKTD